MENTEMLNRGEEVVEQEQETGVTGEELYQAYQDGKSFDELKEMFSGGSNFEEELPPAEESGETDPNGGEENIIVNQEEEQTKESANGSQVPAQEPAGEQDKPYVFKNQKAYQEHFDKAFGKRHAETLSKLSQQEKLIDEMSGLLSNVLGVPKESALEELRKRHYAVEAEQKGYDNPEQYAALKKAENEAAELRRQVQARQVDEQIADIRRQGEALKQKVSGFDLDGAMENELFRQTVFSLQKAGAADSVERAFRAVFFEEFMKRAEAPKQAASPRPREGAAGSRTKTAVKPSDVAKFSASHIKDLERRILNGEKVEL